MPYLTRADIDRAEDLPRLAVEIPEWGGTILIARLPALTRLEYTTWLGTVDPSNFAQVWRLLVLTIVDQDGKRLYGDEEESALHGKSLDAVGRAFEAAMQHNLIGDRAVARAQGESEPSRSSATA